MCVPVVSHNPIQMHLKSTGINQYPLPDGKTTQKSIQVTQIVRWLAAGFELARARARS